MSSTEARLAGLREAMTVEGYDALFVPRADEYLGEYIPRHSERLHWLTGFTGSAGVAVVLRNRAALFVDGRYTVQVRGEVSGDLFEFHHLLDEPPAGWLAGLLPKGSRVACDPRLHSLQWYRQTGATLAGVGVELVADTNNLVDRNWQDRPEPVCGCALLLDDARTGASSAEKRERIAEAIRARDCDAALVFAPDSVSWLLNIRGTDMPQLPVLQSFAMLDSDGRLTLFVDPRRLPYEFHEHVGRGRTGDGRGGCPECAGRLQWAPCAGGCRRCQRVDTTGTRGSRRVSGRGGRPGSVAEGLQERRGAGGHPQRAPAGRGGGSALPRVAGCGGGGRAHA